MNPRYLNPKELRTVCEDWLGTPFKHRVMVKGRGADCVTFVLGVFQELGAAGYYLPWYSEDWFLHTSRSMLVELIEERRWLLPGWGIGEAEGQMDGDIWVMQVGRARVPNHVALWTSRGLYHAIWGRGVVLTPTEKWEPRVVRRYRIWQW